MIATVGQPTRDGRSPERGGGVVVDLLRRGDGVADRALWMGPASIDGSCKAAHSLIYVRGSSALQSALPRAHV